MPDLAVRRLRHRKSASLMLRGVIAAAMFAVGSGWGDDVRAIEATPVVPSPQLCVVTPPTLADLNALAVATLPPATPLARDDGRTLPAGSPADAETIAEITQTVQLLVACYNANDQLRAYSLYSDAYLTHLFQLAGAGDRAISVDLSRPEPLPRDQHLEIIETRGARLFNDGRVGMIVTLHYPSIPVPKTFFLVFTPVDGGWKIDDVLAEIDFAVP